MILELVRLDLNQPHDHKRPPKNNVHIKPNSYKKLLSRFRVYANGVPASDYGHFWLELTGSWLLSCPIDPDYEQGGEADQDLFCRRLRTELVESIMRID